jgi:type VI secretion system protein ImpF
MAELTSKERLQPSLLDRLTDHEPESLVESREARSATIAHLREWVRRDLSWLLNTTQLSAVLDLTELPNVARSTLNYGVQAMAGRTLSSVDRRELEGAIQESIVFFEPRINPESLRVRVSAKAAEHTRNALVIDIDGELWAQPLPVPLELRTELDLEDGSVTVEDARRTEGR